MKRPQYSSEHSRDTADLRTSYSQRFRNVPRRVHILGIGNLGAFVAHALAGLPNRPPITLLFNRRQLDRWTEYGSSINVTTHGMTDTRRGFDVEILRRLMDHVPLPRDVDVTRDNCNSSDEKIQRGLAHSKSRLWGGAILGPGSEFSSKLASRKENDSTPSCPQKETGEVRVSLGAATPFIDPNTGAEARLLSDEEREINAWFAQAGDEAELAQSHQRESEICKNAISQESHEIIHNLIVCVKAPQTVRAIQAIAHRLNQDSTILFLQNGMGIMDEVNVKLFPNEKRRPTYIIGVVTHGLYRHSPFSVIHAGQGTVALGIMPRMPVIEPPKQGYLMEMTASARYIVRTMTRTPVLVAVGFPPTNLLQQQLDKLAVNCIINPLTALLGCKNGALLTNFYLTRVVRLLLAEVSLVIKSLPELKNVPNVNMRFDTIRLERLVFAICKKTAENSSSMLQDISAGRQTEIDYVNGYIVRRGEEMGLHCVMNYMLTNLIKGNGKSSSQERQDMLPVLGSLRER